MTPNAKPKKPKASRLRASFVAVAAAAVGFFAAETLPQNPDSDTSFRPSDQLWRMTLKEDAESFEKEFRQAAGDGNVWRLRVLLGKGADVNAGEGMSFIDAAKNGQNDVLNMLFDKGARLDNQTIAGEALQFAVNEGNIETVEILLDRGLVNPNVNEAEALTLAAGNGDIEMLDLLLSSGAQPAKGRFQSLLAAVDSGNDEAVLMIMSYGPGKEMQKQALQRAMANEDQLIAETIFDLGTLDIDRPKPPRP